MRSTWEIGVQLSEKFEWYVPTTSQSRVQPGTIACVAAGVVEEVIKKRQAFPGLRAERIDYRPWTEPSTPKGFLDLCLQWFTKLAFLSKSGDQSQQAWRPKTGWPVSGVWANFDPAYSFCFYSKSV